MTAAIRVENLSKSFRIGVRSRSGRDTLVDLIAGTASDLWGRLLGRSSVADTPVVGHPRAEPDGTFWALRDVSFDVRPGEVVGIIGRNGAGKSTLLKILSRITDPTSGQIEYKGRVASLLEVGTGFHPELTGRDNVYLNGSLLGMSHKEVARKFDEIVAFSEIEQFLETPVKRYSSGMYVRLAFAVAAHLEPEILVVDEVLAVGDAAFQAKCLGKMKDVSSEGRTVLFVSHNMPGIIELCDSAVLLEDGEVRRTGQVEEVAQVYMSRSFHAQGSTLDLTRAPRSAWAYDRREVTLAGCSLTTPDKVQAWTLPFGSAIELEVTLRVDSQLRDADMGITIHMPMGMEIAAALTREVLGAWNLSPGTYRLAVRMPGLRLAPGSYLLGLHVRSEGRIHDHIAEAARLEVAPTAEAISILTQGRSCLVFPDSTFEFARA